jgi:hypothetical protein
MRREPDFFGDVDLPLVYVAKRLKEALRVEDLLTQAGLDYLVEPDKFMGGVLFRRELTGAFFYVAPEAESATRDLLAKEGLKAYVPGG